MNGRHSATIALADLIRDTFLNHGAGQLDVLVDDIVVAYRVQTGTSLGVATRVVHQRLGTALNLLWERDGWHYVPVTAFYFATFGAGRKLDDASTEIEIKRCIAGIGRGNARVGLHFIVNEDDWLFLYHFDNGVITGHGKVRANMGRAVDVAQAGNLTAGAIADVTTRIAADSRETEGQVHQLQAAGR